MNRTVLNYMLAVVFGALGIFFAFLPALMLPCAVIFACAYIKLGRMPFFLCCAVTLGGALLLGGVSVLPGLFCVIAPVIPLLFAVNTNNYLHAAGISSIGMLAGMTGCTLGEVYLNGNNWLKDTYDQLHSTVELFRLPQGSLLPGGSDQNALIDAFQELLLDFYRNRVPQSMVIYSVAFGLIALAVCRGILKQRLNRCQPFAMFTIPRSFGIIAAAMLLLTYALYERFPYHQSLSLAVQGLCTMAFITQGIAFIAFIFHLKKLSVPSQRVLLTLVCIGVVLPFVNYFLLMTGICEMLFKLREKFSGQITKTDLGNAP